MAIVFLSLGSNLGDREHMLRAAVDLLNLKNEKISVVHETEPWGILHGALDVGHSWFLNMVICGETVFAPEKFLEFAQNIEKKLGRTVSLRAQRSNLYHPRPIDIDILFYDSIILQTPKLKIPHPHIQNRRFVLVPFVEIAPDFIHPIFQKTAKQLLKECKDTCIVRPHGQQKFKKTRDAVSDRYPKRHAQSKFRARHNRAFLH